MRNRYAITSRRNKHVALRLELLEDRRLLSGTNDLLAASLLVPVAPATTDSAGLVQTDPQQTVVLMAQPTDNGNSADPGTSTQSPTSDPAQTASPDNSAPADPNASTDPSANQTCGSTGDPNASASTTADNSCTATDPNASTDASLGGTDGTLSGSNTGTDESVVYIDPVPVDQSIEPVPLPPMDSGTVDGQDTTGVPSDQGNYLPSDNGPAAIQNSHPIGSNPAADNALRQAADERSRLLLELNLTTATSADLLKNSADAQHQAVADQMMQEQATVWIRDHGQPGSGHTVQSRFEDSLHTTTTTSVNPVLAVANSSEMRSVRMAARSELTEDLLDATPQGADLIAGQSAADRGVLDLALDDLVRQIGSLGQELGRSMESIGLAPWAMTLAMAATVYEVGRRQKRPFRPGLAGDGSMTLSWFAGLPGSLSTEHA